MQTDDMLAIRSIQREATRQQAYYARLNPSVASAWLGIAEVAAFCAETRSAIEVRVYLDNRRAILNTPSSHRKNTTIKGGEQ